ncbi:hypothetical protein EDC01DRAFT_637005 [Geopyxis carbonaria]|nr:hypothetical protein EDC01DRAFT_637005 [Geopyxis carbonaria]
MPTDKGPEIDLKELRIYPVKNLPPAIPLDKRVNHMITTEAYTLASTGIKKNTELKHLVKNNEKLFREEMDGLKLWRITETIESLRAASTSFRSSKFQELKKNSTKRSSFRKFTRIASEDNPIRIEDINHSILVQRIKASPSALAAIEEADQALSKNKKCLAKAKRADVESAHFGVWGDFDLGLFETRETEELADKGGNLWNATAQPALQEIAFYATHLNPEAAGNLRKMDITENVQRKHGAIKEKSLNPATDLFYAVAINRKQKTDGIIHQDWADTKSFFNAAMAYGNNYESGWFILWQLKVAIEMKRGDIMFFYGSFLAHNVVDIIGIRNSIDCFTHKSVLDWWNRIDKESNTNLNHKKRKAEDDFEDEENGISTKKIRDADIKKDITKMSNKELKKNGLLTSLEIKQIFKNYQDQIDMENKALKAKR